MLDCRCWTAPEPPGKRDKKLPSPRRQSRRPFQSGVGVGVVFFFGGASASAHDDGSRTKLHSFLGSSLRVHLAERSEASTAGTTWHLQPLLPLPSPHPQGSSRAAAAAAAVASSSVHIRDDFSSMGNNTPTRGERSSLPKVGIGDCRWMLQLAQWSHGIAG